MSSDVQVRRKPINRIEDSDSDIGSPAKPTIPSSDSNAKGNEHKLKYLTTLYPQNDVLVSNTFYLAFLSPSIDKICSIYDCFLSIYKKYLLIPIGMSRRLKKRLKKIEKDI